MNAMITKMIKNEKINILTWPSLWLQVFHSNNKHSNNNSNNTNNNRNNSNI